MGRAGSIDPGHSVGKGGLGPQFPRAPASPRVEHYTTSSPQLSVNPNDFN